MHGTRPRATGHLPSLVAALVHFDVSFMVWMLLAALGAYVAADLSLTPVQKGLMVAVPPLGGAVFRVVIGALTDRHGPRRVGVVSLALTVVPLAWGALAGGTYAQVLGIGLLLGVAGASLAVALPLASRWYPPERQGVALGVVGAGNSGTIVAVVAAPLLAERVGWHGVFGIAIVPVALAWVAFVLLAREPPRPAPAGGPLRLARDPEARRLAGLYVVTFGGFVGLSAYLPILFVDRFGLAKLSAAGYAAVCAATGSLTRPVGGLLADRVGAPPVLAAVFAAVCGLALALAAAPALGPTVVLLAATLGTLGVGNGAVFQLVPRCFPRDVGGATGLVGAAGGLGGFALPFALGAVASATGSFAPGFALLAAAAAGAGFALRRREAGARVATWEIEMEAAA